MFCVEMKCIYVQSHQQDKPSVPLSFSTSLLLAETSPSSPRPIAGERLVYHFRFGLVFCSYSNFLVCSIYIVSYRDRYENILSYSANEFDNSRLHHVFCQSTVWQETRGLHTPRSSCFQDICCLTRVRYFPTLVVVFLLTSISFMFPVGKRTSRITLTINESRFRDHAIFGSNSKGTLFL